MRQANNGNANFAKTFQQHYLTAPGEQGFQGGYSFMAITATQDTKSIGGTQGKRFNMFKAPVREHEKDLNGPSIATLGLFEQNQEGSAFMAVSAAEFSNRTGATNSDNFLAIFVDSGASEHYFDDTPGLRGGSSDYEVLEEPRKITTAGKPQLQGDATRVITRTNTDKAGVKQPVKIPLVVVPGLGPNLFSVPQAALQGAITTFAADASRI